MADNIPPDKVKRRLILFLRIPNEVWTDVLKTLPRRNLVQNISPTCYRLKEICNKNVKSIHLISSNQFISDLSRKYFEAKKQLKHVAGHNCQLSDQFRLTRKFNIFGGNGTAAVLRHCTDLFTGCKVSLSPGKYGHVAHINDGRVAHINECLTYLGAAKPSAITLYYTLCWTRDQQLIDQFLRHPTTWNCNRVKLAPPCPASVDFMPAAMTSFDWLHHLPAGVEGNDADEPVVRCMIYHCKYWRGGQEVIVQLITRCILNLQESQGPLDRRRYVLSFFGLSRAAIRRFEQFQRRHHNQMTGEVLLLEHDQFAMAHRLRRCLAEEAAADEDGAEFYAKIFEPDYIGHENFNIGKEKTELLIM